MLISAVYLYVEKCESDPESVSGTGSPPKVDQFSPLLGPIIARKWADYFCCNPTDKHTNRTKNISFDCLCL